MTSDWRQSAILLLALPVLLPIWLGTVAASGVLMAKYRLTHPQAATGLR